MTSILSCADSRVGPELVFDQGQGDLFVARVAGNVLTPTVLESLEYGTRRFYPATFRRSPRGYGPRWRSLKRRLRVRCWRMPVRRMCGSRWPC
ncbi:MAG TPA: hypothetical protein EYG54_02960 [Myxococcales bacterium]|nr:hypothetical protein [Myxococcales bacterium]